MSPGVPKDSRREPGVGDLFRAALRTWGRSGPRRFVFFLRAAFCLWRAGRRRARNVRRLGCPIPAVVAISPTMRCNYGCGGCYSRGRPSDDELSTAELDRLLGEAEGLGVLAVVLTGGEPLLRGDMLDLMGRHRRLVFVLITNGALLGPREARRIARSGNVVTLLSIEGFRDETDERRGGGAYGVALRAFGLLRAVGGCFGFSATVTASAADRLGSDAFVDEMIALGCSVGYFNEYVPCGPDPRPGWALDEGARARFRRRVLDLRRRKPIVLTQFPDDEYGRHNRCSGAGRASLHINAQGGVEPCPFVPLSRESVRRGGLLAACRSPFLRAIRERPDLLRRRRLPCALFEHRAELEALASECAGEGRVSVSP